VATHFGLEEAVLLGPSRARDVTRARAFLALVAVQHGRHSMTTVARLFDVHPSSVTRAVQLAVGAVQDNPKTMRQLLQTIYRQ
jgi:chromosomal replication initiation ATPase DnaA